MSLPNDLVGILAWLPAQRCCQRKILYGLGELAEDFWEVIPQAGK